MFSSQFRALAVAAVALLCVGVGVVSVAAPAGAAARPVGHPAGPVGATIRIAAAADLIGGDDVATDSAGTAYIGWIANTSGPDTRQVHLCRLPLNATACTGGVQTIPAFGSTADNLRVLATPSGQVTLVWFHNGPNFGTTAQGGEITTATAAQGLHLTRGTDVASAPSNGALLDAEFSPGGSLWTVAYSGVGSTTLQVRSSPTSAPATFHSRYSIGLGQLAFAGTTPVLAISKYGAITTPVAWTARSAHGAWSAFANVPGTWTGGGLALTRTTRGVRLTTGVDDSSYRPVIAAWNGHGFNRRALTPDTNNCGPSSYDGWSDASGRLLSVSHECNDVTIANYADAAHAAIVRFHIPGTPTFAPQIASGTRGIATVIWSNENSKVGSDLHVTRVRLATTTHTVRAHFSGGVVSVTGPTSCLPPVNVRVGVGSGVTRGWKLLSRSLALGGARVTAGYFDGARLAAATAYTLHGTAVFGKGTARSTAKVSMGFRTC